jgi:hypothetical protein
MSAPDYDAVRGASIGILKERHREQESKANREYVYAFYANATPTPEDAHPAVKIVEDVFKAHTLAVAAFHATEASRFKAALIEAEAMS